MQGALRNAIASFIKVSPALKDTIWNFLEQYDLPVAVAPFSPIGQHVPSQVLSLFSSTYLSSVFLMILFDDCMKTDKCF